MKGPDGTVIGFIAAPDQLNEALARIPDRVLLAAYARAWDGHPSPPRRTATGLRRRILASIKRRPWARPTGTRPVPVLQAARELGISPRTLRRHIDDGHHHPVYIKGRSGARTLAIELPHTKEPRYWALIPNYLRPDPRLPPPAKPRTRRIRSRT